MHINQVDPEFEGEFRWRDFKDVLMVYVDKDDVKFALYDIVTLVAENTEMEEEHLRAFAIRDEPRRLREDDMRKEDARSWKVRELRKEAGARECLDAEDDRAREFGELTLMKREDRRSREWSIMYGFDHVYQNPDWWSVTTPMSEIGTLGAFQEDWVDTANDAEFSYAYEAYAYETKDGEADASAYYEGNATGAYYEDYEDY